jgi:hypothetical protein
MRVAMCDSCQAGIVEKAWSGLQIVAGTWPSIGKDYVVYGWAQSRRSRVREGCSFEQLAGSWAT